MVPSGTPQGESKLPSCKARHFIAESRFWRTLAGIHQDSLVYPGHPTGGLFGQGKNRHLRITPRHPNFDDRIRCDLR